MWPFSSPSPSQAEAPSSGPTSMNGTYKPMKRNERKQCWDARDAYFQCLDRNDILDALKHSDAAASKCGKESEVFERDCATSWVKYFKQKRVADHNKDQQLKQLEAEGAVPVSKGSEQSKWKFW